MCEDSADKERVTEADRQQDGMRSARVRSRARPRLREGTRSDARGENHQSLHVQLRTKVDEHRRTA